MTFDDLHLMRVYDVDEILAAFHGHWDPDHVMTRGYRPLSLFFNHVRTYLFGENVVAHRLFLLALFSLYWTALAEVLVYYGYRRPLGYVAGLLGMCSTYSTFHYTWITDGNHLVQGLAFVAALAFATAALKWRNGRHVVPLAWICSLVGLLVREDSVSYVPALLILPAMHAFTQKHQRPIGRYVAYGSGLIALTTLMLAYRAMVVPKAMDPGWSLYDGLRLFAMSTNPLGIQGFDATSWSMIVLLWILLAASVTALVVRRTYGPLIWAVLAISACGHGMTVCREDLLFFPITFMSLFYVAVFWEISKISIACKTIMAASLAVGIWGAASMSRIYAENFHPQSLRALWWNARYVFGAYSGRAKIPEARRLALIDHLGQYGIGPENHRGMLKKLEARAIAGRRRRPGDMPRHLFMPLLPWSED